MMIVRPKSSSPWFRLTPALLITGILFGASLIYGLAQSLGASIWQWAAYQLRSLSQCPIWAGYSRS
jgi:hypothetical protein